ncbi:hypothetical protein AB6A40_005393 [Gnathostoma spinigerum]|uniref:SET domain-containing protein n=1 Tax=Gnathostoma spinigerum TaxID=75299 RepID=A0ABD6EKJ8_9BILA
MSADIDTFLRWASEKGIFYEGIDIRPCKGSSGHGVFSKKSYRSGETLIMVPPHMMITAGKIAEMPQYQEILRRCRLTPFETLVLFFLLEPTGTSLWTPYLNVLPHSFSTPAYVDPDLNAEQLPFSVRTAWLNQQSELKAMLMKLETCLSTSVTWERFLYAWHVVNTRCIYVENKEHPLIDCRDGDTVAVIPLIDMLNHSNQNQAFAFWDSVNSVYKLTAVHCISDDEEVYVCYGGHSNSKLWMEYGFTIPDNIYNKFPISYDLLFTVAESIGLKFSYAHKQTVINASLPCTLYASDNEPSFGLRTNLAILQMEPKQLWKWNQLCDKENSQESELVIKFLQYLKDLLLKKREKINMRYAWLWDEEISVLDACLLNAES